MADTSLVRLTSEEWMNRLRSKESPSLGSDASLVLIDNLEILTGKNATQAYLAKSITGSEGSVVMVTNTDPEDLRQLVGAIGPQVVRLSPPSGAELRRMACLLLESHCTDENLDLYEKPSNPGELMGLIAQISAERTLLPA